MERRALSYLAPRSYVVSPEEPAGVNERLLEVDTRGRGSSARRQEDVSKFIVEHGTASISEIAEAFDVSPMTVHRDLKELAGQGVVRRFRGGASAQPAAVFESGIRYRMSAMQEAKQAIARSARSLVEPGMSLLLDDGSTVLALAHALTDLSPLTIITNYLETIKLFSQSPGTRLISLGGEYKAHHDCFLGAQCIADIASLRADIAFVSSSALGSGSAYHHDQEIAQVKVAMMQSARRRVLLADHSKLNAIALHRFADLSEFDLLITDDQASEEQLEDLVEHSVTFRIAPIGVDPTAKAPPTVSLSPEAVAFIREHGGKLYIWTELQAFYQGKTTPRAFTSFEPPPYRYFGRVFSSEPVEFYLAAGLNPGKITVALTSFPRRRIVAFWPGCLHH
jgi:DeoR/GlpR family transcriptional regulator of sugar metabolism